MGLQSFQQARQSTTRWSESLWGMRGLELRAEHPAATDHNMLLSTGMTVLWAGWDHYLLCPSPQGQLCHEPGNGWQADCSAGHEEWPAQLEWRQWLRSHGWPGSCQWFFAQPARHHTPVVLLYCMPASHAPLMPAWPPTGENIKEVKISNITDDTKKCDQYPAPSSHSMKPTNQPINQLANQSINQSFK